MATLYISEYSSMANAVNQFGPAMGPAQAPQEPSITDQVVTISGVSTQSQPFNAATRFVRLHTDSVCSVVFGPAAGGGPTATTQNMRLASGQTEYYGAFASHQVAVIANT